MMVLLLLVLLLIVLLNASTSDTRDTREKASAVQAKSIRKAHKQQWIEDVILFQNKLVSDALTICLIATSDNQNGFCIVLADSGEEWMRTFIGSKWTVTRQSSRESQVLEIIGGKHVYRIDDDYFIKASTEYVTTLKKDKKVVYIKTPDFCDERYTIIIIIINH